jgi:glycosyltransferase involved in cell wall biosynthesis
VRILAVGTRFFPFPHAGDKTFWFAALQSMASAGDEVRVLSIDLRATPVEPVMPHLEWQTLPAVPFFLGTGPHRDRYNPAQKEIGAITNYVSKSITMPRLFRALNRIARDWSPDVVHFMDNLGPATLPFLPGLPTPSYVSAVTYDPRYAMYDLGLRLSLEGFDGVAASSDGFRDRLRTLGVPSARLRTVRWGVPPVPAVSPADRKRLKREIGVDPERPLVFWSGFLQQTTVRDFWTAFEAAERAAQRAPDWAGIFCFKAQHYRPEYAQRSTPRLRVSSDPKVFLKARECADLFLNPVTRYRSILAPPLTWVEVLMRGIPILTTPCGGVDESLGSGSAGAAAAPGELADRVTEWVTQRDRLEELQRGARQWAVRRFSLAASVRGLHDLWRGTPPERSGSS